MPAGIVSSGTELFPTPVMVRLITVIMESRKATSNYRDELRPKRDLDPGPNSFAARQLGEIARSLLI